MISQIDETKDDLNNIFKKCGLTNNIDVFIKIPYIGTSQKLGEVYILTLKDTLVDTLPVIAIYVQNTITNQGILVTYDDFICEIINMNAKDLEYCVIKNTEYGDFLYNPHTEKQFALYN